MRFSFRSLFALASILALAAGASAQLSGLKTNLRTIAETGLGGYDDTHDYQNSAAGSLLSGHSEAAASDANASSAAQADATAAYGDLFVDLAAQTRKNPDGAAVAIVTHDGAPSTEWLDRIYVIGANPGATVTIHLTGILTDLDRVDGNNRDQYNTPQGVDATLTVNPGGGNAPAIHLTSYRAGADVFEDHSGAADITATVGGYFDLSAQLYGDVDASDTYFRSATGSVDAVTRGRFLTGISADDSNVRFLGASGHVYQAVPEPASFAALGVGLLAVLRRRARRS